MTSGPAHGGPAPPRGAAERRVERLLFAIALLLFGWHLDRDPGPNVTAQVDQATAIVCDGTLSIDSWVVGREEPNTVDWARGPDGRYYPAKAPGMALASVPAMAALVALERACGADPTSDTWVLRNGTLLNVLLNAPLAALSLVALLRLARGLGVALGPAVVGVAAVGFGTAYHLYATIYYAHVPAANLVICAACAVFLPGGAERRRRGASDNVPRGTGHAAGAPHAGAAVTVRGPSDSGALRAPPLRVSGGGTGRAALAGFLAGLAVLFDYPAAFAVVVLGGALAVLRPRALPAYVAGGLAPLVALLAYHDAALGGPLRTPYAYQNPLFNVLGDGGLIGPPRLWVLLELTFLPLRGLFFFSPVLLLAPLGAARALSSGAPRLRVAAVAGLALLALWLTLNSAYGMWWAGATSGPRFIIPALPLLAPLVALGIERLPRIGAALLAVSTANYLVTSAVSPFAADLTRNPLVDTLWASLLHGVLGRDNVGRLLLGIPHPWSLAPAWGGALVLALLLARAVRDARAEDAGAVAGAAGCMSGPAG